MQISQTKKSLQTLQNSCTTKTSQLIRNPIDPKITQRALSPRNLNPKIANSIFEPIDERRQNDVLSVNCTSFGPGSTGKNWICAKMEIRTPSALNVLDSVFSAKLNYRMFLGADYSLIFSRKLLSVILVQGIKTGDFV